MASYLSHSAETEFETLMKFRRYFTTHPDPQFRKRFPGRLEVLNFGDMVLDDAISTFRDTVNERHDSNWPTLVPADGMNGLHLDYIESTTRNAFAFYIDDLACIAVTAGAVSRVLEIAQGMAVAPSVHQLLGLGEHSDLSRLASALFSTTMQVLTAHEMGHIMHGHCYETRRSLPVMDVADIVTPDESPEVAAHLRLQAMEVEADGYCAHMLIGNLVAGSLGKSLTNFLETDLNENEFSMVFLLLAAGAIFYLFSPRNFKEEAVEKTDHPFALMRMNVFTRDLHGWCVENHPSLSSWATLERFRTIMEAIEASDPQPVSFEAWARQGEFILSPPGDAYTARLYAAREKLRVEMESHQWHLLSETGNVA